MSSRHPHYHLLPDDIIGQIMNLAVEPFEKAARLIQRMLRGTHSRYKLFANVRELHPNYMEVTPGGRTGHRNIPFINGSNNTLPFLLNILKNTNLRGAYRSDGMERYQWEAGFISKYMGKRHRRYPPKVRAKIFYADL